MTVPIFPDDWGHPNTPFWIVNVFAGQAAQSGLKAQDSVQWTVDMTSTTNLQEVGLPVFPTRLCAGNV